MATQPIPSPLTLASAPPADERSTVLHTWTIQSQWNALPIIGDVRGQGLFAIVELVKPGTTEPLSKWPQTAPELKQLVAECRQRGVSFAVRGNLIVLSPPLVISQEDLEFGLDVLEELLGTLAK